MVEGSDSFYQLYHILYMGGMREHVYRLYLFDAVLGVEHSEVACLCGGIAAYVYYALRFGIEYHSYHIFVHAGARRVYNHYFRASVDFDKSVGEHIFHVAGKEFGIFDAVGCRVDFSVLNGFGYIFYAYYLAGVFCHEVGYGARAGIEVVDEFIARQSGKLSATL